MSILEQIEEKIGKCPQCGRQVTAVIYHANDLELNLITRCTKCNIKYVTPYIEDEELMTVLFREHLKYWKKDLTHKLTDQVKRKNFHKRKRNRGRVFANWRYVR